MSDAEKLRSTIDQLHAELADMDVVDEEAKQLLQSAVSDIHTALEQGEPPGAPSPAAEPEAPESHSIVGRLSEAARRYEDSHPTLSGIIGSIIDTLGRMGI